VRGVEDEQIRANVLAYLSFERYKTPTTCRRNSSSDCRSAASAK
jgi:hypothetical protein